MILKKILFLMIACLLHSSICKSDELKIRGIEYNPMDLSASVRSKTTSEGKVCSLIKIATAEDNLSFSGDIYGKPVYDNGEYLIYMLPGVSRLDIICQDGTKLSVDFLKFGIQELISKQTYTLDLNKPSHSISIDEIVRDFKPSIFTEFQIKNFENELEKIQEHYEKNSPSFKQDLIQLQNMADKKFIPSFYWLGLYYLMPGTENLEKAELYLRLHAENSDSSLSPLKLGNMFYNQREFEKAFEYYFIAKYRGARDADLFLGRMLMTGIGTDKDEESGADFLREWFWKKGHIKGDIKELSCYYVSANTTQEFDNEETKNKALKILLDITQSSDKAMEDAIRQYYNNNIKKPIQYIQEAYPVYYALLEEGVRRNISSAINYTLINLWLVNLENKRSWIDDYKFYFFPENIKDKNELFDLALKNLRERAQRAEVESYRFLGRIYHNYYFTGKDEKIAYEYFKKGAELNDMECIESAAFMTSRNIDDPEARRKFFTYLIEKYPNNAKYNYEVGKIYMNGIGMKKPDNQKAIEYFQKYLALSKDDISLSHDRSTVERWIGEIKAEIK